MKKLDSVFLVYYRHIDKANEGIMTEYSLMTEYIIERCGHSDIEVLQLINKLLE